MSYSSESRREGYYISHNSQGFHRIAYSDWGPDDGRLIICVHGLTGNGHDFDWLAHSLAQDGYRVIAVDLPGRGRSDFLSDPNDYNYNQYIADLTALLAHLDITAEKSIDWIGVSLGGLLGLRMAALKGSPIDRLILNDIGPEVPQTALDFIAEYISKTYRFKNMGEMESFMRETRGATWGPITDEQWHAMAENNARATDDGFLTYAYDPQIAHVFNVEPIGDLDFWPLWDAITQECFVIRGADSVIFRKQTAEKMNESGPGALGRMNYIEFDGCGHVPSLMAPYQIDVIRNWLKNS